MPNPGGEEATRKAVGGHAGDVSKPPEVPSCDVSVDVEKAEAATNVFRGYVVESAVASGEMAHSSGAVVVESS